MGRPSPHATHPPPATRGSHPVLPGGRVRRARRPVHAVLRPRFGHVGLGRLRRARLQPLRRRFDRGLPRRHDAAHHGARRRRTGDLVAGALGMDGAAGHDDRRRCARVSHAHAALELLRPRQDAQRRRLGRCPDAAGRAADDRADRPRDRACERLPPGRHLALRAPRGRRADHRRLGRLRHAGAPGCDRRRRDHAGRRLGRRREPNRRPLASRRRLRHRRRRRQRVGSRERLACQRRDLDRLVRSAHRLAVSAGAALGSGAALPVCSGARRRHPPRRRRRRRCER